jgi:uncharacterized membrane protein
MALLDDAREQARLLVEKVTGSDGRESGVQAVTVARSRHDVIAAFRNPEFLSQIFGEIADVDATGPDRLHWTFHGPGNDDVGWECVITAGDTEVTYAGAESGGPAEIVVAFRDAPQDRGTEVVARVSAPAAGLLTGPLTFKALYRARAVLQTGEIPTIRRNPSARNSPR